MPRTKQVAVVPVRRARRGLEVCLIRRKDTGKWGIPKGYIERGFTAEEAGLNEALEEAGLKGRMQGDAIGTYDYTKFDAALRVAVYLMEVVDEQERWLEMRFRERAWHSPDKAAALLDGHPVVALWDRVKKRLAAFAEV